MLYRSTRRPRRPRAGRAPTRACRLSVCDRSYVLLRKEPRADALPARALFTKRRRHAVVGDVTCRDWRVVRRAAAVEQLSAAGIGFEKVRATR